MGTKSDGFKLRLDPEMHARWQDAADRASLPLAEFVRRAVEAHVTRGVTLPPLSAPKVAASDAVTPRRTGFTLRDLARDTVTPIPKPGKR